VVNGRSPPAVEGTVQRIRTERKNAQVMGVAADLGTKEGVNLLIRDVPVVDILVNNLGIFEPNRSPRSPTRLAAFLRGNVLSGSG